MTIKELKEIIKNCSDNDEVCINMYDYKSDKKRIYDMVFSHKEMYKGTQLVIFA